MHFAQPQGVCEQLPMLVDMKDARNTSKTVTAGLTAFTAKTLKENFGAGPGPQGKGQAQPSEQQQQQKQQQRVLQNFAAGEGAAVALSMDVLLQMELDHQQTPSENADTKGGSSANAAKDCSAWLLNFVVYYG